MPGDVDDGLRHGTLSLGIALTRTENGESPRPGMDPLEAAPDHARRVAAILREFRYLPWPPAESSERTDGNLVDAAVVAEDLDVLIVHIVGHGELAQGGSEKLYVLDARGKRLSKPVGAWLDLIEDFPDEHRPITLFVLDVCYAGHAAVTAWHARMEVDKRRAWVLAATGPRDQAFGYRLSRALVQVLETYRKQESRFDPSLRYIPPQTVWRDVERAVNELAIADRGYPQAILTSLVPGHADLTRLPFFPNPSFASGADAPVAEDLPPEIARLKDWAADPLHFMRHAGGAEPLARDWAEGYFTGRTAQLDDLSGWLDDEASAPGFRVVTGKPGSGKSALLGVLVCAAHPALRRHSRPLWAGLGDHVPGESDRIAVIHMRRMALDDIVECLARQLCRISAPGGEWNPSDRSEGFGSNPADYLLSLLPGDGRVVTLVLDALDEAERPQDIITALLLPLVRHAQPTGSRLRLLVGTRHVDRFRELLTAAQEVDGCTDLDSVPAIEVRRDVADYVKRLLVDDGPYAAGAMRAAREAVAEAIAETLTQTAQTRASNQDRSVLEWGEFLTAGLYVHYLLSVPAAQTPEDATRLGRAVPKDLHGLLELDLQRHRDQTLLRPLLTALAFAQGRGMPEQVLLRAAAGFIPAVDGIRGLTPQALYQCLDGDARFYLRRDVDTDGSTLYRLFHESLADWLRARESLLATQVASDPRVRLCERLLDSVPVNASDRRQWHLAAPYLLRHIARHAVLAGCFDELLGDGGYLQHADPHTLVDSLGDARSEQAKLNAAVYQASWGVHHMLPPSGRRQLLALDAARFCNGPLRAELPGDSSWQVRWATGSQVSTALVRTLTGHAHKVQAVAVTLLDGRPHAVTGGGDGSLRVWDLITGAQTRELAGHPGGVTAVDMTVLDGRPHAVTGDGDGSLRVWDLITGAQTRELAGHPGGVTAVDMTVLDGRPHAVTGGGDGLIRVWDLTTGTRTRLACHTGGVRALAVTVLDRRPHAVTGGGDGMVRVWDLTTGKRTREIAGHARSVSALAVTVLDRRPHAVTGGGDGMVRVWDLTTGKRTREIAGHARSVSGLAVTVLDRRPHAVTSDTRGSVQVWDLTTGTSIRELAGHTNGVRAVAVAVLDGHPHAVTSSDDRSVRLWDLTTAPAHELVGHTSKVTAASVISLRGRPCAVTGDSGGSLRLWDLATGTQVRQLAGHPGGVKAVTVLDDWPHAVTAGGDGSALVWNPFTGTRTRRLAGYTGGGARALAVTVLNGRPHVVTGDTSGLVRVWNPNISSRNRRWTSGLAGHNRGVTAVAVTSLNGRPCAVTGDSGGSVRLWDLTTGTQIREIAHYNRGVTAVAVTSLNGRPCAVTGDSGGSVRLWDLTTGTQIRKIARYNRGVTAVAVTSLNGRPCAVTGDSGGSVRLWDLTTGAHQSTFGLPAPVGAVAVAVAATPDVTLAVGFGHEVTVLTLVLTP